MFKPVGNRVLIQKIEEVKKSGLLIMPQNSMEDVSRGKVVSVSAGSYQNGVLVPPLVKEGDVVLYAKAPSQEITDEAGNKFEVISDTTIIGTDN